MNTNQVFQPAYSNLTSRVEQADKVTGFDVFFDKVLDTRLGLTHVSLSYQRLGIVRLAITAEVYRHLVITAIALKRFELRHGKFPETLTELTPAFTSAIPLDAMNGQPLQYHLNIDGTYVLYSVGENGIDDGGDTTESTRTGNVPYYWFLHDTRDWVWPQPATQTEIDKYYTDNPEKKNT